MVSWVWTYCKKIDNDFSSCNICLKRIARCGGTKSMISHLTAIHKITKDTNLADVNVTFMDPSEIPTIFESESDRSDNDCSGPSMQQRRSWVWGHFSCIDKEQSACHICKRLLSHRHGTKGLIAHLKAIHAISKPDQPEDDETDGDEMDVQNIKSEDIDGKDLSNCMGSKRSWAWSHYSLINKDSASCNHCKKVLSCKDGTKGLIKHLEALHFIFKAPDQNQGENSRNKRPTRSWIWPYYTVVDKLSARCNICRKVLVRGGGTSGLMKHLQSQHSLTETSVPLEEAGGQCFDKSWNFKENLFDNFVEFPSITSFSKDNCYVCNEKLSTCRNKITIKTKLTATPVYEFLETFTGVEIGRTLRSESFICHECLVSFEQYDKWQHKSAELQNKMTQLYHDTHTDQVFVKQEPELELEDYNDGEDYKDRKRKVSENSNDDWWHEDSTPKRPRIAHIATENSQTLNQNPAPVEEESICVTCSKRFKNPALFEIHLLTDHERSIGPFNCSKCSKTCKDLNSLKSHYSNHSLPRSLLCNKCGATFSKRRCLEMHLKIHDDIRPYACTIPGCSKRFLHSFKLKCHLRVHSGEKIFECPYCPGRMFAQKWGMDLHIRKQHMNEPTPSGESEECKICGIRFNSKSKLKVHLENVHEVAPQGPTEKTEYSPDSN